MLSLFATCSSVAVKKKNLLRLCQAPPEANDKVHCSDSRPLRSTHPVAGNAREKEMMLQRESERGIAKSWFSKVTLP